MKPGVLASAFVVLLLVLAASGCRAPGEPPSHPEQGEYQDLIRREIDAAGSALATGVLVLRYIDQGDVPDAYGKVVIRQAENDLRKVAQDLSEINPPALAASAQTKFRTIVIGEQHQLDGLYRHLANAPARQQAHNSLSKASDTLDQQLKPKLDPT
jgi:hypothetical protein